MSLYSSRYPSLFLFFFSLYVMILASAGQGLPPREERTMSWSFGDNFVGPALIQCQYLTLAWWSIDGNLSSTQSPFTFTFYLPDHETYTLDVGTGTTTGNLSTYDWLVNLPVGGPYFVELKDANGATGSIGQNIDVVSRNDTSCTQVDIKPSSLTFSVEANLGQCGTVDIKVSGGEPPYTLTALQEDAYPKVVHYATSNFSCIIDVESSSNSTTDPRIGFAVTDSRGRSAVAKQFTLSNSGDFTCLREATILPSGSAALDQVYSGNGTFMASSWTDRTSTAKTIAIAAGTAAATTIFLMLLVAIVLWKFAYKPKRNTRGLSLDNDPSTSPTTTRSKRITLLTYSSKSSSSGKSSRAPSKTESRGPYQQGELDPFSSSAPSLVPTEGDRYSALLTYAFPMPPATVSPPRRNASEVQRYSPPRGGGSSSSALSSSGLNTSSPHRPSSEKRGNPSRPRRMTSASTTALRSPPPIYATYGEENPLSIINT